MIPNLGGRLVFWLLRVLLAPVVLVLIYLLVRHYAASLNVWMNGGP